MGGTEARDVAEILDWANVVAARGINSSAASAAAREGLGMGLFVLGGDHRVLSVHRR